MLINLLPSALVLVFIVWDVGVRPLLNQHKKKQGGKTHEGGSR